MNNSYDKQIADVTTRLIAYIATTAVSTVEKKRLLLDLYTIQERLEKKEYQKANFSPNKFDIEERNNQIFTDLEFYCLVGKTWSYIFDTIDINKTNRVVDICAGYSPKVELGLYYAGYQGDVMLLDKSTKSNTQLIRFMDLIQPGFTVKAKKFDILKRTSSTYDVVIGNHIIDDIVIDYFANEFGINTTDLYMYESKPKELWNSILKDKNANAQKIIDLLTPSLASLVKNGGYISISHYESYADMLLGLQKATVFNMKILKKIGQVLCNNYGFVDEHKLLEIALDDKKGHFKSDNCILLRKKLS